MGKKYGSVGTRLQSVNTYSSHDHETDVRFKDNRDQYNMVDYHVVSLLTPHPCWQGNWRRLRSLLGGTTSPTMPLVIPPPESFIYGGKILEPVLGSTTPHSIVECERRTYLFCRDCELSKGVDHSLPVKSQGDILCQCRQDTNHDRLIHVTARSKNTLRSSKWCKRPNSPKRASP